MRPLSSLTSVVMCGFLQAIKGCAVSLKKWPPFIKKIFFYGSEQRRVLSLLMEEAGLKQINKYHIVCQVTY